MTYDFEQDATLTPNQKRAMRAKSEACDCNSGFWCFIAWIAAILAID